MSCYVLTKVTYWYSEKIHLNKFLSILKTEKLDFICWITWNNPFLKCTELQKERVTAFKTWRKLKEPIGILRALFMPNQGKLSYM